MFEVVQAELEHFCFELEGVAVRALLAYGYTLDDSRTIATPAIGFVADTLATDIGGSRRGGGWNWVGVVSGLPNPNDSGVGALECGDHAMTKDTTKEAAVAA
ncbi:MAG TPA: hypothetical protein VJY34_13475, partial [Roseiarcus sp.]|nr:hypothetical protein [Roseiarcus sp.]